MSLKYFWIETYGCQMNKAETESLAIQLQQVNLLPASSAADADLVFLNTCSVRKTAEDRIWGRIGHYKYKKNFKPELKLIVMGCMAERLKTELLTSGVVDLVIGNFEKHRIGEIVIQLSPAINPAFLSATSEYHFADLHSNGKNQSKAMLPVMHGCDNWCSYCIVPHVRGREVSRQPDQILSEIAVLETKGIREITLLGQNVNSYRFPDNNTVISFPRLLELIIPQVSQIEWIRFLTSHPKDCSDDLIRVIKDHAIICRHLHLPVQHGSNKILESMHRGYSREFYLNLIEKIRQEIPGISITTDLLIGYPGEDNNDFKQTLSLMQKIRFSDAFTYKYNPREGTRAYQLDDSVPEELKLQRLAEMIDLQRAISSGVKQARLGNSVKVLIEAVSKKNKNELLGRTEKDEMVVFSGNKEKIGNFTHVKLVKVEGNTFLGEEE